MHRRFRGLRNTLAFFDQGVDTVILRTDQRVAERVVGYDAERQRFQAIPLEQAFEVTIGGQPM